MKNKKIILVILMVLVVLSLILFFLKDKEVGQQEVSMESPIDIVLDFYDPWLASRNSVDTNPYKEGLNDSMILSKDLRNKIFKAKGNSDTDLDPVLCQSVIPSSISARTVYEQEEKAQILILARDEGLDGQAIVSLNKLNGGWYINDIECSAGEFGPPREFTFEREGVLIKDSTLEFNSEYWHILFVENNEVSLVPLFFNGESICILSDKEEEICKPEKFEEEKTVTVYGDMSETGATVKKLEF